MTIKEAVLRSLEELERGVSYKEVTEYIIFNQYLDFSNSKTPENTVSGALGDFIRKGDTRVMRVKKGTGYDYYLTKNISKIALNEANIVVGDIADEGQIPIQNKHNKQYLERSLHVLLATYLNSIGIFAKTIYHESSNKADRNKIWIHPDMVGLEIRELKNPNTQSLLKSFNKSDFIKFFSYEIKREIHSDIALKEGYFQALSNSSWANYGYLVALDFDDSLKEEMRRLNQAHGIGFIALAPNPFESKVLFPAQYKNLDFFTMDKLTLLNPNFNDFVKTAENIITAPEKAYPIFVKEFKSKCESVLLNDTEIEAYCKQHYIPIE